MMVVLEVMLLSALAAPVLIAFCVWVRRNGAAEARLRAVERRAAEALASRRRGGDEVA